MRQKATTFYVGTYALDVKGVHLIFQNLQLDARKICSVADPGSGAFLPQVSGIRIRDPGSGMVCFPDLGSRILTTSQIQDFTFKNDDNRKN
jgi:hypothetical protein